MSVPRLSLWAPAVAVALLAGAASAAPVIVYDSFPAPLPGSVPSLGYEATSTDEFGDHLVLGPGPRKLTTVSIGLTDWACGNDYTASGSSWIPDRTGTETCETVPGTGFTHPITVKIYNVTTGGPVPVLGTLIASRTQDEFIPFRPSHDPVNCATGSGVTGALSPASDVPFGGTWYSADDNRCYHGHNSVHEFDFSGLALTLPEQVIVTVSYNTADYGAAPIHGPGPFNSLNVSLPTLGVPLVGARGEADTVWWDTSYGPFYCDGGAGGSGTLRRDSGGGSGCWDPYLPAFRVSVARRQVGIDVRPNNLQNQINTNAKQLVPIAILGSADLDVHDVDVDSVSTRGAWPLATKTDYSDVNGDGLTDLTLYFRARDIGAPSDDECADPAATLLLEGSTSGGEAFEGSDHVTWQGC